MTVLARPGGFGKVYDGSGQAVDAGPAPREGDGLLPETDLDLKTAFSFSVRPGTAGHARLLYWGLLLGLLLPGLNLIAAGLAWLARTRGQEAVRSHYANQVSLFWKSVICIAAGLLLTYVLIGVLVLIAGLAWYMLRIGRGLRVLGQGAPVQNPDGWLL